MIQDARKALFSIRYGQLLGKLITAREPITRDAIKAEIHKLLRKQSQELMAARGMRKG